MRICAADPPAPTRSCSQRFRKQLLGNKVAGAGVRTVPTVIATANIGCLAHIQTGTALPVRHWVELLDEALARPGK